MSISPKLWCFFAVHEWKIIGKGPYKLTYADSPQFKQGTWFNLQCAVCGNVKMRRCL